MSATNAAKASGPIHRSVVGKKTDLIDFQRRLNANLDAGDSAELSSLVGFQSGGKNWLIDLSDLREIGGYQQAVPIKLAKRWVLGISNFGGTIYTMIDWQMFLGLESSLTIANMHTRSLLLNPKHLVQAALVVSGVSGLVIKGALSAAPTAKSSCPWVNSVLKDDKGGLWELLDVKALAASREMMSVEKE